MLRGMCKRIIQITRIRGIRIRIFTVKKTSKNEKYNKYIKGSIKMYNIYEKI